MNKKLVASEKIQHEYCCTVVRIGKLVPIQDSNFLATTLVNGIQIVVRKDETYEGDIMIYAMNETQLNKKFLSVNNLFELSERALNKNYLEVQDLLDKGFEDEAKRKAGFFNKHGRVKCIRLRKQPSFGFLFHPEALYNWKPELKDKINFEDYIDKDFDTVDGELFVKVYVPFVPERRIKGQQPRERGVKKIDHVIDGQFFKHYDTVLLNRAIGQIKPTDIVTISVKIHGTSGIFANILCNVPKFINTRWSWFNNIINYIKVSLPKQLQRTEQKYDLIYSSRNRVLNKYVKVSKKKGIRIGDTGTIWEEYANNVLKPYIPEGMTIYGEIIGYGSLYDYVPGDTNMIQKGYDYGCEIGNNMFMPYRITTQSGQGEKIYEWNVIDVYDWTLKTMETMPPEIKSRIHPIDILYHGTLSDLYPNIKVDENWHSNILEALKNEKRFGMENPEPMCIQNVPREGIVLRIDNDPLREAFKLKTVAFFEREQKLIDQGEVDGEMFEGYTTNFEQ